MTVRSARTEGYESVHHSYRLTLRIFDCLWVSSRPRYTRRLVDRRGPLEAAGQAAGRRRDCTRVLSICVCCKYRRERRSGHESGHRQRFALVGRWSAVAGETLIFAPDGTYQCVGGKECADLMATGVWHVKDRSNDVIELRPSSSPSFSLVFSVVKYQGRLRLAHYIEDPDTWDGEMPFALVAPP